MDIIFRVSFFLAGLVLFAFIVAVVFMAFKEGLDDEKWYAVPVLVALTLACLAGSAACFAFAANIRPWYVRECTAEPVKAHCYEPQPVMIGPLEPGLDWTNQPPNANDL